MTYDAKPTRLPPIKLAAALLRDHGDIPLCCQAAATIRDQYDALQRHHSNIAHFGDAAMTASDNGTAQ